VFIGQREIVGSDKVGWAYHIIMYLIKILNTYVCTNMCFGTMKLFTIYSRYTSDKFGTYIVYNFINCHTSTKYLCVYVYVFRDYKISPERYIAGLSDPIPHDLEGL